MKKICTGLITLGWVLCIIVSSACLAEAHHSSNEAAAISDGSKSDLILAKASQAITGSSKDLPTNSQQTKPPKAVFSASPASGFAPLTVHFTDSSTGTISSYQWSFGDGGSSTAKSPGTHVYNTPNTYTITLTVTGPGGVSTAQHSVTVKAAPPVAGFTANPSSGKVPLNVQFTNTSTGSITSYAWTFGDGSSSSDQNPSHTYSKTGTFKVTLTVKGPGGSKSVSHSVKVTPIPPPVAGFTAPSSATINQPVTFTNTSTGNITAYSWTFGDGSSSSETSPTHIYTTARTYTVTLKVTGPGGSKSVSHSVKVTK